MAIYRFKVAFEDNEDVYREIEIKSTQTFEDLHNIIVQSISFDNQHNASFYISDDYWRKGQEIVLRADAPENGSRKKQETEVAKKQMNKCKMASLIDDPHQKFVYVYDLKTGWTFLVELLKIVPDDAKATYPRVAKSAGESPKQYKPSTTVAAVEEEEFDEDDSHSDDVAYENAHSEDETALLGSEEGEEEASDEEELVESEEDEGDAAEFDDHAEENFEED